MSQYILGIQPTLAGLKIDPCIPHEMDGFTLRRVWRGATYEIVVENPDHVEKGVKTMTVDGKHLYRAACPGRQHGTGACHNGLNINTHDVQQHQGCFL